jgi:acetylornithine deacetylase/succinyl-diaminopimelate desuccinylase-like protein
MHSILKTVKESLRSDVTDFAQRMVRTTSPSLHEGSLADLVEKEMKSLNYDKVVRDEAGNVIGLLFGQETEPAVLLNSHMDTVHAETQTPNGRITDGKLFGAGAADCKGGLAAQIYSGALLKRSMLPLKGTVVIAATAAEENGASIGTRALMEQTLPKLGIKPNFAILGEPTNLGLYYGHDGWMEVDIYIEGANPFMVRDAAQAIVTDYSSGPTARADGNRQPQLVGVEPPSFDEKNGMQRATIRITRRLNESEDSGDVLRQIKHEVKMMAQPASAVAVDLAVRARQEQLYTGRTTTVQRVTHAWAIDPFCVLLDRARQSLAAAKCEVRAGKWRLGRLGMGTAGGVLVNEFQVPTIGYGPGLEDTAHSADEYVEIEKVVESVYGTAAMVHGLVGIPICGWTAEEI